VKLVFEVGGFAPPVAARLFQSQGDVILISSHDSGTGAISLTSLKHAGLPMGI